VFKASPEGSVEILAAISGRDVRGAYLHSLSLTANFVVLCVWPAFYSCMGMSILWNRNLVDSIQYDGDIAAKWYVIDRRNGRGLVSAVGRIQHVKLTSLADSNVHHSRFL
jgi:torulene dioxygenase